MDGECVCVCVCARSHVPLSVCLYICVRECVYTCVFCVVFCYIWFFLWVCSSFMVRLAFFRSVCLIHSLSVFLTLFQSPFGILWIYMLFYFVLHFYFNVTIAQFCGYVYVVSVSMYWIYKFHSQSVNGSEYLQKPVPMASHTHIQHCNCVCVDGCSLIICAVNVIKQIENRSIFNTLLGRTTCFFEFGSIGALISNTKIDIDIVKNV